MLSSLHIKSQENSRRLLCLALSEQLGIWMRVGGKNTEKLTLKCEARECVLQFLI